MLPRFELSESEPITSFWGRYAFLSNFYPAEVTLMNLATRQPETYPTVEHAFQAAKSTNQEDRNRIRALPTPGQAKRAGRKVWLREDWERIKLVVMRTLVTEKFTAHPRLTRALLSTGERPLVEENTWGDTFWGVCDGVGENHLGRILMEVRASLRRQPLELPATPESDAA